jgi:hypothetical protein
MIKYADYPFHNLELENMEGEEWRDVVGYDGLYEVSNLGRVKRLERETKSGKWGGVRVYPEKIVKQSQRKYERSDGVIIIPYAKLSGDGNHRYVSVSVLVGEAFIGTCEKGFVFSKKNKISHDCRADNLEISTDNDCISLSYQLEKHKRFKACSEGLRTGPKSLFWIVRKSDGKRFEGRHELRKAYPLPQANTIYDYSKTSRPYKGDVFYRVLK